MSSQNEKKSLYSLDYFAGHTSDSPFEKDGSYLEVGSEHLVEKYKQLLDWMDIKPQSKVLDVGSGPGHLHHAVVALGSELEIVGLELHKDVADFAISKGAKVLVGDMIQPPEALLEQTFDVLVLNDVIEHVSQEEAIHALNTLKKMLVSQGKLFLRTPNGKCTWTDKYWRDLDHKHMYAIEEMVELVARAGFTDIKTTTIGHVDTQDFYATNAKNSRPQAGAIILLSAQKTN